VDPSKTVAGNAVIAPSSAEKYPSSNVTWRVSVQRVFPPVGES
jgi:hypothetical protein